MTHTKMSVGLRELSEDWSFNDLMDAHGVLDALEAAEAEANRG